MTAGLALETRHLDQSPPSISKNKQAHHSLVEALSSLQDVHFSFYNKFTVWRNFPHNLLRLAAGGVQNTRTHDGRLMRYGSFFKLCFT
jgi:hypothetical protein